MSVFTTNIKYEQRKDNFTFYTYSSGIPRDL